jgi:hypothetical protein
MTRLAHGIRVAFLSRTTIFNLDTMSEKSIFEPDMDMELLVIEVNFDTSIFDQILMTSFRWKDD